ncbi:MAG: glycosyltransferase [Planctomycetota bacterium]
MCSQVADATLPQYRCDADDSTLKKGQKLKILMISYPFPPYGGMSKRNVYFANRLVEKGHQVDVLSINPSRHFHGYDSSMVDLISPQVRVHRTYAGLFHHLGHRFGLLKTMGLASVATAEWFPYGLWRAFWLCRKNRYDAVYCHGDPFLSHLIAYLLKKKFGIPLVAYIGDPRSFGVYSKGRLVLRTLEPMCLSSADQIIVNCEETLDGFVHHFPFMTRDKFTVITDGFDERRYETVPPESSDKFRIVYTGVFYQGSREPFEFFNALKQLNGERVEALIAGTVPRDYIDYVSDNGLSDKVIFLAHQSYNRVIALQKGASLLLVVGWGLGYQLPGKVFEYIAARRPIFVIRNDDKDVASKLVLNCKRGVSVANDAGKIASSIRNLYGLWQTGKMDSAFDLTTLRQFDWSNLADNLEEVLLHVVKN